MTGDGEAAAFEGWALVALYVILATLTLYEAGALSPRVRAPRSARPAMPPAPPRPRLPPTPSSGAMNSVWMARRPGPVKRFQVSLPPPPKMPVFRPIVTASSFTDGSLYSHPPASTSSCSPSSRLTRNTFPCPCSHTSASPSVARNLSMKKPEPPSSMFCTPFDPFEAVVEVVGRGDELVLAHVQPLALAQVQGHALARRVAREGDPPRRPEVRVTKNSRPAILRLIAPGVSSARCSAGSPSTAARGARTSRSCSPISICSSGTSSPRMW